MLGCEQREAINTYHDVIVGAYLNERSTKDWHSPYKAMLTGTTADKIYTQYNSWVSYLNWGDVLRLFIEDYIGEQLNTFIHKYNLAFLISCWNNIANHTNQTQLDPVIITGKIKGRGIMHDILNIKLIMGGTYYWSPMGHLPQLDQSPIRASRHIR